jgi:hypothetical protein
MSRIARALLRVSNCSAPQYGHSRAMAEISVSHERHGIVAVMGEFW